MSRLNALLRILTLGCEAASELSSRELDDSLSRLDRAALLCHVLVCKSCRRFRAQIRLIREAIRRRAQLLAETDSPEGRLSAEARYRIALACREVGFDDAGAETMIE
ncbi:MAG: zf-HC2 domain-containing protein [Isosphaeraceae bacterium]